jgi:hypothetical protein
MLRNKIIAVYFLYLIAVGLHLSGLNWKASDPDKHKIRITEFFFENRLHWRFEVKKKISTNGFCRLHIYFCTNITLIHNSLYVFENWG